MPKRSDIKSILIIGAGPIVIGQACEFDYSGAQACKALREEGYKVILVNSNPATIMTDPETADRTYIEPITPEMVEKIIAKERPDALLPNLGGQTGLNLSSSLHKKGILDKYNVRIIGVQAHVGQTLFVDLRQRLGHTIDKRLAADQADVWVSLRLSHQMFPPAKADFQPIGAFGWGKLLQHGAILSDRNLRQ